jgi:mono/diheme cytochrome c family protein
MRGTALTGWGILIVAVAAAVLLVLGLYAWDSNGRAAEVALRPPPVAPLAGGRQTARVIIGVPTGGGGQPLAGNASVGQRLFLVQCNACHPGASAGIGPAVRGQQLAEHYVEDGSLATAIRQGTGDMRPFPPDQLSDQELADVVAYLRGL